MPNIDKVRVNNVDYDIGGSGGTDNYSTTEQVIGTWIDGKPLYRRVFTYQGAIGNSNVEIGTIASVDKIVDIGGSAGWSSGAGVQSLSSNAVNSSSLEVIGLNYSFQTSKLYIGSNTSWSNAKIIAIVKYTKTTDTANS